MREYVSRYLRDGLRRFNYILCIEVMIQVDFLALAFLFRFNVLAKASTVYVEGINFQRNYSSKTPANCFNHKLTGHRTSRKCF